VCDGRREAFTFLGYTFGPMRYRKDGHWYLGAAPAKKAVQRVKGRIRRILRPGNQAPWGGVMVHSANGHRTRKGGNSGAPPDLDTTALALHSTE
jgi:hypothetical protein